MNPFEPIEQVIREELAAKGQPVTDENVRNVGRIFVAHMMSGKDFRVAVKETIDDILYQTESYGGMEGLIVA